MASQQHSFLALLHRANQIANEKFAGTLGESDMTARQVQVLAAIQDNLGASQNVLVNATGIDRSTLADIVRRMEKSRLIGRRRSKQDARAYMVRLTETGRKALAKGMPALAQVEQELLGTLSTQQRAEFIAMLEKVVATGEATGN